MVCRGAAVVKTRQNTQYLRQLKIHTETRSAGRYSQRCTPLTGVKSIWFRWTEQLCPHSGFHSLHILIISQWKHALFWSKKIICLHRYSVLARSACCGRQRTSSETGALRMRFKCHPSPTPLSWPSKTSSTSKKQKNSHHIWPTTTLDFLPAQVYSQKPSSYPNQRRQKTFGVETKRMRVTPSPSTGDSGVSSRVARQAARHSACPALPWAAWFTGIAQAKRTARAGDDAATCLLLWSPQRTAAGAGRLPLARAPFPGQSGTGHRRREGADPSCSGTQHPSTPQQPEQQALAPGPAVGSCLPSIE